MHLITKGRTKTKMLMQTSRYAYLHSVTVFKNHKKVSFNSASEASYVYILSGQKLIENAKKSILVSFGQPEACDQTVLPDRSI